MSINPGINVRLHPQMSGIAMHGSGHLPSYEEHPLHLISATHRRAEHPPQYAYPASDWDHEAAPSIPQPAPSTPAREKPSLLARIKNEFVAPRDPLNPLPPSFSRPPPAPSPALTFAPFRYMSVRCRSVLLTDGFPLTAPIHVADWPGQPHPFATHNVQEADWVRFLEDIAIAALLKTSQRVVAGLVPLALHVGLAGIFVSLAMERYMKKRKGGVVGELIDIWNSRFFNPRRMDVVLALGETRFSGRGDGPLPDRDQQLDYIPPGTSDIHLEEDDRQSRKRARRELKQRKRKWRLLIVEF